MMTAPQAYDVVTLGAGAAGLMCALTAGQRGRKVLLLDRADQVGSKILISGGGRCNFTNLHSAPDRFLSDNPEFCRSALSRYTQADFISLVERHGIPYHEKTLGQLFCDGSARAIVAMLLAECAQGRVDVRVGHTVTDISHADGFRVDTTEQPFTASALVLATGGLSIPKMGATGFAYGVARRFGLGVIEPQPGLVPLKATPEALGLSQLLAGVSVEAVASCGPQSFRENILFTHRGLSGPAILQISSYWREGETISLDLTPELDAEAFLKERKRARPRAEPKSVLGEIFPLAWRKRLRLGCRLARSPTSPTARSACSPPASSAGRSSQPARKATPRPRSPSAGSIRAISHPKQWRRAPRRGSISSAKPWT